MKYSLLLSVLGLGLFSSCTTAFKSGQTPDDVYFSPGREAVALNEDRDQQKQREQYQEYISSMDDRYLRMKIANRNRWSTLDDFGYWNDSRYDFNSYNYQYYSSLNPYWHSGMRLGFGYGNLYYPGAYGWGWSSPVYTVAHYYSVPYTPAKTGGYTSASFATAYRNKSYHNSNYGFRDPKTGTFVPGGSSQSFGNLLKRVFSSSESTSSYDRPARTFTNTTPAHTNTYTPPATNSNAGGTSGGFQSTGSSASTGRGGRG